MTKFLSKDDNEAGLNDVSVTKFLDQAADDISVTKFMHTSNDVTVTKFLEKISSNLDNAKFLAHSNGDMAVSKYLQ